MGTSNSAESGKSITGVKAAIPRIRKRLIPKRRGAVGKGRGGLGA
jgi:hypothetical protein